jgi:hypothetical protein
VGSNRDAMLSTLALLSVNSAGHPPINLFSMNANHPKTLIRVDSSLRWQKGIVRKANNSVCHTPLRMTIQKYRECIL